MNAVEELIRAWDTAWDANDIDQLRKVQAQMNLFTSSRVLVRAQHTVEEWRLAHVTFATRIEGEIRVALKETP